jgi:hypothetical protein
MAEACMLLKVWLNQRKANKGVRPGSCWLALHLAFIYLLFFAYCRG